jgi:hypothetical protein
MNVLGKQAKEARALKFKKRPRPALSNASGRKLYGIVDNYGTTAAEAAASPAGSARRLLELFLSFTPWSSEAHLPGKKSMYHNTLGRCS